MSEAERRDFLEEKVTQYNQLRFIHSDPISIPHLFLGKEDREIAGFFAATFAWGKRKVTISKTMDLIQMMGMSPSDFIRNHRESHLKKMEGFVHRTFNFSDLLFFMHSLQRLYLKKGGLEAVFTGNGERNAQEAITNFRQEFFATPHLPRSQKHLGNPLKKSTCKRLNMFLRWMVRLDTIGVDFGIWRKLRPHQLSCPLDVHSARVARKLGLLKRKSNDWKAVQELDAALAKMDPDDPVKYDFALFGLGVFEKF